VPSGGALLVGAALCLAAGLGSRLRGDAGLRLGPAVAWCLLGAAASTLNLPAWRGAGWQVLVNPGGTLVPLALAGFLWTRAGDGWRAERGWAVAAGCLGGLALGTLGAWGLGLGLGWPDAVAAAALGVVWSWGHRGRPRAVLLSGAVALVVQAAVALGLALAGWAPWPPSVGGGAAWSAGVAALLVGALAAEAPVRVVRALAAVPRPHRTVPVARR
jgi:hypothetical protein